MLRRRRPIATAAVCVASLVGCAPAWAGQPSPPKGGPAGQIGMSDEFTTTRWAYADASTRVRGWPSIHSRARSRLRLLAPDQAPEVYVVRSTWRAPNGREWTRIRIPSRPRQSDGWVPRSALSRFGVSHDAIRVNRRLLRLTVYKDGKPVLRARVGIGRPGWPTPAGHFWVRGRYHVDGKGTFQFFGRTIPFSVYGPEIIMTTAYSPVSGELPGGGIIGIHGTDQPSLIPGRPSHGCVRVINREIRRIYPLAPPGTPVDIV